MIPVSIVVSGLISSRVNRGINFNQVNKFFEDFDKANKGNEIIVSTYNNEMNFLNITSNMKVIINKDPGINIYRNSLWKFNKKVIRYESNLSRMLTTTLSGLSSATNKYVIKTRIELIPTDIKYFYEWLEPLINNMDSSNLPQIAFLKEHYSGISHSIDGTIGGIPDTFQIAKTEILQTIWSQSKEIWDENFSKFTNHKIRLPITSEQLIGYSYLSLYTNFRIEDKIRKLTRGYISLSLLRSIIYSEKYLFYFLPYKETDLSKNYFKGTYSIRFIEFNSKSQKINIFLRLTIVYLKKSKHYLRRFKREIFISRKESHHLHYF
jgi:hypothetical protein